MLYTPTGQPLAFIVPEIPLNMRQQREWRILNPPLLSPLPPVKQPANQMCPRSDYVPIPIPTLHVESSGCGRRASVSRGPAANR